VIGSGVALWLALDALRTGQLAPALGAGALLAGVALSVRALADLVRGRSDPAPARTAGVRALQLMARELDDLERIVRYWQASALILLGCAGAMMVLVAVGRMERPEATLLAAIWASTAALLVVWGLWRRTRIRRERAAILALGRDYSGIDPD
jgi:uncharacterized membrane protein YgcG